MTLIVILLAVFACVALMVVLGERFGKPMEEGQQSKYSKIIAILCGVLIIAALVREIL